MTESEKLPRPQKKRGRPSVKNMTDDEARAHLEKQAKKEYPSRRRSGKIEGRKSNGHFKEGNGIATGRKPSLQCYLDRAANILDLFTAQQIVDIVSDRKQWNKWSARDMLIFMDIAEGYKMDGGARANKLLDRVVGRPKETLDVRQKIEQTTTSISVREIDSWLKDIIGEPAEDSAAPPVLN